MEPHSAPHLPSPVQCPTKPMIGPAVGVDRGLAATMIAAIDQHVRGTLGVHLAEGDFLRGRLSLVVVKRQAAGRTRKPATSPGALAL
jgi:hypothetical protein